MPRTVGLDARLYDYLLANSPPEHPVLAALRRETASLPQSSMQIGADQGAFFQLLVSLTAAKRCLEVGVFTGYSALAVALALPDDGHITACDISEDWTAIARRYWQQAGMAQKIDLRIAPAVQTLDALIADGAAGSYDFAFVDADKAGYAAYHDRVLTLLRPGGLVAYDNVLWGGAVADPTDTSTDTVALRKFNTMLAKDPRIRHSMLPLGDGVTLALKR
jgi:predicted O-methyltransferase YrrM